MIYKKKLRFEKSEESFLWLEKAGTALPVYNVTEPRIPLKLNEKSLLTLFLSDVGMLTTIYGKATKAELINNGEDTNNGAIYENAVAQELLSHGFPVYYYNSKRYGELDFVIEYKGKILPIEVKSGKMYKRHSALNNILSLPNYSIDRAIVLSNYNVEKKGNIIYYPIYMLMFLVDDTPLPQVNIK